MQKLYADVIVDITAESLDRTFQYAVPEALREILQIGSVVEIPFGGGNRLIRGYVVALGGEAAWDPEKIKDIIRVVTEDSGPMDRLVHLAAWMKERYGCTMIQALRTVIPVRKKIRGNEKKIILLHAEETKAREALEVMRRKHQTARARLLEALLEEPVLPGDLIRDKLHISAPVLKALQEQELITVSSEKIYRNPLSEMKREENYIILNPEQRSVCDRVISRWEEDAGKGRYLLHGVTGSGKTEVYMELIAEAIRRGEQAVMLIPEIALTYQTVMRFYRRFGDRVSLINSRLSAGERYDQFQRAAAGEIDVMIGPRSALFTPFPRLGIIVIDEEHEPAYNSETTPRYSSRETAFARAGIEGARVVLGSATPSLEAYYGAGMGEITLLELKKRTGRAVLPSVIVTDLREELKKGCRGMIGTQLQEELQKTLEKKEQAMLFLNRRGIAGFISCRMCGHVVKCPHCDVSLSLHRGNKYVCHYCGYEQQALNACPSCGSGLLRTFKAGTQQVQDEVAALFPEARLLRMDADTTKGKDGHEKILTSFADHEADILIGTQMIVKGHDFPDVTLVGVLAADLSLFVPDYRASERTFQLLTQAAGRAGRAEKPGMVVIQSYDPDHYCIRTSAGQDYKAFYEQEIEFRILSGYPPAGSLAALHLSCEDETLLETACKYLGQIAKRAAYRYRVSVLGPADEAVSKIQDQYRKVLYLKGENAKSVMTVRDLLQQYIEMNAGFARIMIQYETE